MTLDAKKITQWLFETEAVKISPADRPFWYTSGNIGPYYVNTHYLYGSSEKAEVLLKVIDKVKGEKLDCPSIIAELTIQNYRKDKIFGPLMDMAVAHIRENIDIDEIDVISGGERRDWFFSFVVAHLLKKPHITIFKDLSMVYTDMQGTTCGIEEKMLSGANVLHIADLVTEASSYARAWIPAIASIGANIVWTQYVIDRKQGGEAFFKNQNIISLPMVNIDISLFEEAHALGYMDSAQLLMLKEYVQNPDETMRQFLLNNPEFLQRALQSDEKTAQRAKLCLEKNIYRL